MHNLLEERVVQALRLRHETLVTAESCTGGLIAERITRISGASEVFLGGVVAYANTAKSEILGVSPALIAQLGAVSDRVAREMAQNARLRFQASWAVSVTGVAGPGGGTPEKPVGTVYLALSNQRETLVQRLDLLGLTRSEVRCRSADFAFEWLLSLIV